MNDLIDTGILGLSLVDLVSIRFAPLLLIHSFWHSFIGSNGAGIVFA